MISDRDRRVAALERAIQRLSRRTEQLRAISRRFSWSRLGIILIGGGLSYLVFRSSGEAAGWISVVAVLAIFVIVARFHQRVERGITRFTIWQEIKNSHIARMTLDWERIPVPPAADPDPDHPFEIDLDLTGPRSLQHLIDTSMTREGSSRLREWLLNRTPDMETIRERQSLLRELTPLTIFRDKLTLHTRLASRKPGEQWEATALLRWLDHAPAVSSIRLAVIIAAALAAITIPLFILNAVYDIGYYWVVPFILYLVVLATKRSITRETLEDGLTIEIALAKFNAAFSYLESYRYGTNGHLKRVSEPFLDKAHSPSREFKEISRIVAWASFKNNPLIWLPLNAALPVGLFLSYRLTRSKAMLRRMLPIWLDRWFELEALNSLANFAALNPEYTFPSIIEEGSDVDEVYDAKELGHPLIKAERKSRNDFAYSKIGELTLITGSNMAGKSTFLRTLGINLVLAYAGGPVDAVSLSTRLFRLYTSIKISDSLSDGFSFFYAEVRRLRSLLDELERDHPYPLIFLVDEIFRGTNNRERLIGSTAYIRALVGSHGVGVIATHDLELVRLADEMPEITNRHFREEVVDGAMVFDYKLRTGPCPTTNALLIMQLAGLPVKSEE